MTQDKNIIVSIIIPAYNYGRYLGECLDSVINQTFKNWECIIIDNGSTDNTQAVASHYVSTDKRISYYFTEQMGVSFARNRAVQLSKGIYILPLDADDKIAPGYVEKAVNIIEQRKDIKVVYCDAQFFGAKSGEWILPKYSLKALLIENSIFCSALFRKRDFELSGGYNENMKEGFEDWDFWINMLKDGSEVYKIPEILFYYRIRSDSRNSVLDRERQLVLRRRIFENHRELYDKSFYLPDLIFEYYSIGQQNKTVLQSWDFKLGFFILKPLRFVKKLLNR